ncbi:MAG: hypothetical protein V1753_08425 [Pseudomonadota bacterium]
MNTKTKLFCIFVIAFSVVCCAMQSIAESSNEFCSYLRLENFNWKELDDDGVELLEESGQILGVGADAWLDITEQFIIKLNVGLFGGDIDYDGQTQGGTPVKSNTEYVGMKMECDAGVRWTSAPLEQGFLMPFLGIGYRRWDRTINSTDFAVGYTETWTTLYGRLGIHGDYPLTGQTRILGEIGVKPSLLTENDVNIFGYGVTLKPGNETSLFGEIGIQWPRIKTTLTYEGMKFSKSDVEDGAYQPESQADIIGVEVGIVF